MLRPTKVEQTVARAFARDICIGGAWVVSMLLWFVPTVIVTAVAFLLFVLWYLFVPTER